MNDMNLIELCVPQMGEGLHEVLILEFLKKAGDPIRRGDHIYNMETDKTVLEVESPHDGVLHGWCVSERATLAIGATVALIELSGKSEVNGSVPAVPHDTKMPSVTGPNGNRHGSIPPRSRAYATRLGLSESELKRIPMRNGKLMPDDVDCYLATRVRQADMAEYPYVERRLSDNQRRLAHRLVQSQASVVPATVSAPIRWDSLEHAAKRLHEDALLVQPSAFQLFAHSVALAVRTNPLFRSTLHNDTLREYAHVNLGIAVPAEGDNLITAVVVDADTLSLLSFVSAVKTQIRHALKNGDQAGETMQLMLTYLGGHGIRNATPVLCAPAIAVLFIGAPYPQGTEYHANLALTFDHRAINGVAAARFLSEISAQVEQNQVLPCH